MHCLYCDRPLALLKRLTGDGEFCSKEHRKIYQKEHNELALARLLESQPNSKGRTRPGLAKGSPAKPRVERAPDPADFVSEFPSWASVDSKAQRPTDPLFRAAVPALVHSAAPQASGLPKVAGMLSEPRAVGVEGKIRLADGPADPKERVSVPVASAIRRKPAGAGFAAEAPSAASSHMARRSESSVPQFAPLATRQTGPADSHDENRKLLAAAFLSASVANAATAERPLGSAGEPRWKPLAAALPARLAGKITPVLGALLQRPVRAAEQDSVPEIFEIRIRPIGFPPYSPRMGSLEERAHHTDRIGLATA
jgi:hypothetical protein